MAKEALYKVYIFLCIFTFLSVTLAFTLAPEKTSTQSSSVIPFEAQYQTYTIDDGPADLSSRSYTYEKQYDLTEAEKQELFDRAQARKEAQDKYDAYTKAWSKESFESLEEKRIEAYCEDNGFYSCYNIKYTCESETTCHKVKITCDDNDFDPAKLSYERYEEDLDDECDDYEVEVEEKTFNIEKVKDGYLDDAGYQW